VQRPAVLLGVGAVLAIVAFQLWITPSNPPGYHRDEAALVLVLTAVPDVSGIGLVLQAIGNWFRDIDPWHWATAGDPAPYVHNGGYGAFFGAVMVLALSGVIIVLMRRRDDLWRRYVLLATLLVPVPAALTVDRYNAIRLAALPVLLLVLAIPALDALVKAALRRPRRAGAGAVACR
jgi:hypothetical protein